MKLKTILEGIEPLELHADPEMELTGLSCDSRAVREGELFVAVTGFEADGWRFIPAALEKGAAVVVCERPPEENAPYVLVESSRKALALASANWYGRPAEKMTFLGVTGTNGKTTTTILLKHVLEQALGAKVGLVGTIQNMIGDEVIETERTTPESCELQALFAKMAAAGCTHVVMEVSSHSLVLDRVAGIPFDTGVFTNLTQDHLDFHKTMEAYLAAKAILFTRCRKGVLNLDDKATAEILKTATCACSTYSIHDNRADLTAENVRLLPNRVEFEAVSGNDICRIELGIPGGFSVYNALAVIGAAQAQGIPLAKIAEALKTAHGVKGRVEVVPTPGRDFTVLIDYAHSPDSLENVLRTVRGFCKGRVVAVFGCGGDRDVLKRPIMGKIAAELADFAVVTSDNPRTEDPNEIIRQITAGMEGAKTPKAVIENRRTAIRYALDHAQKDDVVVLCGKGHETYQILGHEKTHLDEREEVAAWLEESREQKNQ